MLELKWFYVIFAFLINVNVFVNGKGDHVWQDLPLTCIDCIGGNCNQNNIVTKKCELMDAVCRTLFNKDGKVIRRGCSDEMDKVPLLKTDCTNGKNKFCFDCRSNQCNVANMITDYVDCYRCDSSNAYCLQSPIVDKGGFIEKTKCYQSCMVALFPKTADAKNNLYELARGCLDDKEKSDQKLCTDGKDSACKACKGNNCNGFVFPENRLQCRLLLDTPYMTTDSHYCSTYKKNDKCIYIYDKNQNVRSLNCESDFLEDTLDYYKKMNMIQSCSQPNCNFIENEPFIAKRCLQCSSEGNSHLCATKPNVIKTSVLCYGSCYTMITGSATERGCSDSRNKNLPITTKLLKTCDGNMCNNEIYPKDRLQCYTCSSLQDKTCKSKPAESDVRPCSEYYADNVCITATTHNITNRFCASASSKYFKCEIGFECKNCKNNRCNGISGFSMNLGSITTILMNLAILGIVKILYL